MKGVQSKARAIVSDEQRIAPVTILDAEGRIVRVVPAEEFRRAATNAREATASAGPHTPRRVTERLPELSEEPSTLIVVASSRKCCSSHDEPPAGLEFTDKERPARVSS
jgi:hypothetical protein